MPEQLRVLHVIDSLAPGGAERMLVELVNAAADYSVSAAICVTRHNLALSGKIDSNIPIFCLKRSYTWDLSAFWRFGKYVRQGKYNVIHAHGYSSFRFAFAACSFMGLRQKIVLHVHSSAPPDCLTVCVGRWGVAHLIATALEPAEWAQKHLGLPDGQISLLPNAIEIESYRQASPKDISEWFSVRPRWIGVVVANILPAKDYAMLFQALALSTHRQDIGVLVVGALADSDYFAHCQKILLQEQLSQQVIFVGERLDVAELLISADFGLLTSQRETGPLVLLEYMAAGLPFVTTQVGQVGRVVVQSGLLAPIQPGAVRDFCRELDTLLDAAAEEWDRRRQVADDLLKEHFSLSSYQRRLKCIYERLTSRGI